MKIAFLNRYQSIYQRGAEIFIRELSDRLSTKHVIDLFEGKEADSLKKVLNGGYDIVIPVNGRLQSLKVSLARLLGGYKLLITGHSGIGRDDIWNIVVAKPDVFVALTDHMARWAKSWAWGTKVVKIPNGIDIEKFKPQGERMNLGLQKPIVLSVGALVWYKYHERIIEAMARLDEGSLLIAGEGLLKDQLEKKGKRLLGNRFKITNFNYKDMPRVYRSSDLFSLPSWDREAFGIVYLEAMASGLGVVAPGDLSRREIVGDGGLFTDVNNPAEYAETIKKALNIGWAKKARTQVEKFSWEKVAELYEDLMLGMIKPK